MASKGMRLVVHGFHDPGFAAMAGPLGVDFATGDAQWPFAFGDEELRAVFAHDIG
jgi:hypothetical protein